MNPKQLLLFIKYPYAVAVLASIWIGSACMAFINQGLPIITIVIVNVVTSWVITWLSFRYDSAR